MFKVFTSKDFRGIWPVGTAAVIVAETEGEARNMLYEELRQRNISDDDFTLQLLNTSSPQVLILRDGEY